MMIERIEKELSPLRVQLQNHSIYEAIHSIQDIRVFMEHHVFAVWDFMSLLKQLQNLLSCNTIPWRPSGSPAASRLINEIVWGEESDLNRKGIPMSHFEMYIEAMDSLGANPQEIHYIIEQLESGNNIKSILESSTLPKHLVDFMKFTFEVVQSEQSHIIAAVFTFGREDLIPDMFIEIIRNLKKSQSGNIDDLVYYFERHIEVDSGEHGPLALKMIQSLCGEDSKKWEQALSYSKQAMQLRIQLWDGILMTIQKQKMEVHSS
ncbi:DUF3050 domain-containing protein [Flavobacteriaceae bacterium]|nr:DUF3050 domain-containing protein [Flavobacteriaceae bacterium]